MRPPLTPEEARRAELVKLVEEMVRRILVEEVPAAVAFLTG
jgi:hypothetical protein